MQNLYYTSTVLEYGLNLDTIRNWKFVAKKKLWKQ